MSCFPDRPPTEIRNAGPRAGLLDSNGVVPPEKLIVIEVYADRAARWCPLDGQVGRAPELRPIRFEPASQTKSCQSRR